MPPIYSTETTTDKRCPVTTLNRAIFQLENITYFIFAGCILLRNVHVKIFLIYTCNRNWEFFLFMLLYLSVSQHVSASTGHPQVNITCSYCHWLCIFTSDEQDPACCAFRNLQQRRWPTFSQLWCRCHFQEIIVHVVRLSSARTHGSQKAGGGTI
jgi:hypothetical protein